MITLTWSAFAQIVEWGQSAHAAAKKKSEQRYARIVEHSAILVSGVATLNRQLQTLLQPIAHFDPSEWDQQRRTEHVDALIAFGSEEVILPRLRTSRSALRGLLIDSPDVDVLRFAGQILAETDDLYEGPESDPDVSTLVDSAVSRVGDLSPDPVYNELLPRLLELLRNVSLGAEPPSELPDADKKEWRARQSFDVGVLRVDAQRLLTPLSTGFPIPPDDTTSEDDTWRGVLFPAAASMQRDFGDLLAVSQRAFPTMPTPTFDL